jgi:hypothetical protein
LRRFEDTLVSVLENQPERSEVVVVTNQPYDDPYDLRGEVAFVEAPLGASLLQCLAAGLAACHAPVVHLLAAGMEAAAGWTDAAVDRFADDDVAAVAPLVVDRDRPQTILSAGLRYSRSGGLTRIAAGRSLDQFRANERLLCGPELGSAFYRRDALARIASLPNYGSQQAAAVELALALLHAGYRCVQEPQCLLTANGDLFGQHGGWSEGVAGERLFHRWTALPTGKRSWLGHAVLVAAEGVQAPFRPAFLGCLAGRLWATLGLGRPREVAIGMDAADQHSNFLNLSSQFAAAESRAA